MKKKGIWILTGVLLLAVLFVPVPTSVYKDGGTRVYSALTYKIVCWNRLMEDGVYQKTRVYFLADRFRSLDGLWEKYEEPRAEHSMVASIVEVTGESVTVKPVEGGGLIRFGTNGLADIGAQVGNVVNVIYTGSVMETSPGQINVVRWEISRDLRHMNFPGAWMDKDKEKKHEYGFFSDMIIDEVYADCFFARPAIPLPYRVKFNGTLPEEWCVGDKVHVTYENAYYDEAQQRGEADLLEVTASDFTPDPDVAYKPVIYLYPETETDVSVRLRLNGRLTCTYPAYGEGWQVTAMPDGTLTDVNGLSYNYLYWEGELDTRYDFSKGFCVRGEDTAAFLEEALAKLGLTRREANEFIVYWLPQMQENPYNLISFQTQCYLDAAGLEISPVPDTLIRVFMAWMPSEIQVEMEPQLLNAPERTGFTVVEWGGTRVG